MKNSKNKRLKYVYNPQVNKPPEGSDYSQKLVNKQRYIIFRPS